MLIGQRAQGIVEFAVVLPLFLLLSMGVIYFGMAFSDYLTMSNTVRSVAHEASLKSTDDDYKTVIRNATSGITMVSDRPATALAILSKNPVFVFSRPLSKVSFFSLLK
ncbi:MAG: pilus assembly protein, partial [Selenomonadaceae bacterium]|nr:pilus assembly protein [Selenomonadaceae bacterium]